MSHFSVLVLSGGTKDVEELLAPYQENSCSEPDRKYLEFYDEEDELIEEYKTDAAEMVRMPDGRFLFTFDEEFRVGGKRGCFGGNENRFEIPDGLRAEYVKFNEAYSTFEKFMSEFHSRDNRDEEKGRYGYWENPNSKWDWYQIGGRYKGLLRASKDWRNKNKAIHVGSFDQARIGDCDFSSSNIKRNEAIDFWERVVDGKGSNEDRPFTLFGAEFFKDRYGSKEIFADCQSAFSTWACVTPNGEWSEKGSMGWFACSDETHDEAVDWELNFRSRFIDQADKNLIATVVDCHI